MKITFIVLAGFPAQTQQSRRELMVRVPAEVPEEDRADEAVRLVLPQLNLGEIVTEAVPVNAY